MKFKNLYSRRKFIQRAGQMSCAGVGSSALFSSLLNLGMSNRAAAQVLPGGSDYKALVCLFMSGGNDSFNMLVPTEADEYAAYQVTRSDLALPPEDLMGITDSSGRGFGIHHSMPEIRDLYNAGQLSFIANVGSLVEPTSKAAVLNDSGKLPLGLYSHADQSRQWMTSVSDQRSGFGWGGRTADLLHSLNDNDRISMNISVSGNNIFQSGLEVVPYTLGRDGVVELNRYNAEWLPSFKTTVDSLLDQEYQNLYQQTYTDKVKSSIEAGQEFSAALNTVPAFLTTFPDYDLANDLQMIASSIGARTALGVRRQVFFVDIGGWDFHDELIESQEELLGVVSQSVAAFWGALGELGMQNNVTLFTASDFGRTLTSNDGGNDHAWGGNQFVLGGSVNGGEIYGEYPETLAQDSDLDVGYGRGVILPTTAVDQYMSELSLWLGVQSSDLSTVFPNIERFYDPTSASYPLGFMS